MSAHIKVRFATAADVAVIARHRAEMFSDMGQLPAALYHDLVARTTEYLRDAIASGEYVGWIASPERDDQIVAAGAGVQRRRILPHPLTHIGEDRIAHGHQAVVLNVFTEKGWRRQGVAALLMQHVIEWARRAEVETLVLHASDDGRALYETLGFQRTNEMRYARPPR